MPKGLAPLRRAELIAANIRGAYDQIDARGTDLAPTSLAGVVKVLDAPPKLAYPPTTRALDDKGRLSIRLGGQGLAEVMDWSPGPLRSTRDGAWVVLRQGGHHVPRRNDGTVRLGADGRLRLPAAARRLLGVAVGEEVVVLALPDHAAVALCHPSRLLVGAPLSLVNHRRTQSPSRERTCER